MDSRSQKTNATQGFSLLELLIVFALVGILTIISVAIFERMYKNSVLRAAQSEVYNALVSARARTLASENDTVYGVRLASTSVTRFIGSTFVSGTSTNQTYAFEGEITATGTIVSSSTPLVFTRLTGQSNIEGTIYLRTFGGTETSTVTVHKSGLIEYD